MKTYLMQILLLTFVSNHFVASAQTTWRGTIKLNTPITFFSMSTNPTALGQCGVELSLGRNVITQVNFQLGQFSNFKSSVAGKQGNFKNEFMLAGCAIGYDMLSLYKPLTKKRYKLFLSTGFSYMPSKIKYFKTDDTYREVDFTFWFNTVGAELRYSINNSLSIVAFSDFFISQSAWVDGNPAGDQFDHFMTFGAGVNFKLSRNKIQGLNLR
jgi:hypothetical protein